MKTFAQFKRESLKRPGVRKAMEDIGLEFQIIEAIVSSIQKVAAGLGLHLTVK